MRESYHRVCIKSIQNRHGQGPPLSRKPHIVIAMKIATGAAFQTGGVIPAKPVPDPDRGAGTQTGTAGVPARILAPAKATQPPSCPRRRVSRGVGAFVSPSLNRAFPLSRKPHTVIAMKIDSAAVSGRSGGFQTRPDPGAVGRNRHFCPLMWPSQGHGVSRAEPAPYRTPIRGGNPGGAWRMFYLGRPTLERP